MIFLWACLGALAYWLIRSTLDSPSLDEDRSWVESLSPEHETEGSAFAESPSTTDDLRQKRHRRKPSQKGKKEIIIPIEYINNSTDIIVDIVKPKITLESVIKTIDDNLKAIKTMFTSNTEIINNDNKEVAIEKIQNKNIIRNVDDNNVKNIKTNKIKQSKAVRVGRAVKKGLFNIKYIILNNFNYFKKEEDQISLLLDNVYYSMKNKDANIHMDDVAGHRIVESRRCGAIPTVGLYS
jgi:hypothetical protein